MVLAATAEPCRDTIPDCHYHRREEICHGIYVPWASARCAFYCGFCTVSGDNAEDCRDTIPNCVQYQPCNNPNFFVWVEDHCRKSWHHSDHAKDDHASDDHPPPIHPRTDYLPHRHPDIDNDYGDDEDDDEDDSTTCYRLFYRYSR
ncbi:hypothetical protein ACOMHN_016122 [Nucella lapillus]